MKVKVNFKFKLTHRRDHLNTCIYTFLSFSVLKPNSTKHSDTLLYILKKINLYSCPFAQHFAPPVHRCPA